MSLRDTQDSQDSVVAETQKEIDYPTFTNTVVVIRPDSFYENKDCMTDNKFSNTSPHKKEETNRHVSLL